MVDQPGRDDGSGARPRAARPVGAHPLEERRRRPWWLWLLLALLAAVLLSAALSRCGNDTPAATAAPVPLPTATGDVTPTPTAPSPTVSLSPDASPSPTVSLSPDASASPSGSPASPTSPTEPDAGQAGTLTADGAALLPATAGTDGDLSRYVDDTAAANGVTVQSVPADEGFWVGSSATDRVFVRLTRTGSESPLRVRAGDRISFADGQVVANAAGFAAATGVDTAEGARQLSAQRAHIDVPTGSVQLSS